MLNHDAVEGFCANPHGDLQGTPPQLTLQN